jgi:hypothetical protein
LDILQIALLAKLKRMKGAEFSPLTVIQTMYPEDWELFQEDVLQAIRQLAEAGEIEIIHEGKSVNPNTFPLLSSKIRKPHKLI